ncbi:hypothetical protein Celaphus_00010794 [Cervus elaphus hippelaphus]|uniref:Uncharacterized protein n=1 Tax=Cervus elaphus hippelaphus TaxID=46360 RepID=A0A212CQU4_CEREH|nr:hypothetical protein Celaphus_00010794 [Cervus elaphus hippelaphus]
MDTDTCASQSGMTASSTRWHLYDPENHILPPWDHLTISLQMGTNKCDSQVGTTAPGTRQHIYNTKLGTDKCDNSSMSLQVGYMQGANQSGQVFGLGRQIYDPKYCPHAPVADGAPATAGEGQAQGSPQSAPSTTGGGRLLRHPCGLSYHITDLSGFSATDIWHLYNTADIDNKEQSELDQDLDDVEEEEEEETGEETKIKARQLTVQMMQNPQILAALQERLDVPESGDLDDDSETILTADFEIGHFLHEHVIQRSVLYFTGEATEDDDDYDEEGEEADEEGEEEGDDENDPGYNSKKDQNPADCK